jgi:hypothetical protein
MLLGCAEATWIAAVRDAVRDTVRRAAAHDVDELGTDKRAEKCPLGTRGSLSGFFGCRRSVRQLRGPPFERDDPHRELERASIERLRQLRDSDKIVA